MLKILLILLQMLLLISCDKGGDLKELITIHSDKTFYYNDTYLEATGVWKVEIDNVKSTSFFVTNGDSFAPHTVKINCNKKRGCCYLKETILGKMSLSDRYYLTTNEMVFSIKTWYKNTIIAINTFDYCFTEVLYIDITTQEVLIKSFIPSEKINFSICKTINNPSNPILHKLIDYRESPYKYYITIKNVFKD